MQVGVVVAGSEAAGIPATGVHVVDRVVFLGSKTEEPVPGWVGWNVRLINAAEAEAVDDALVGALHGAGVFFVEGAFIKKDLRKNIFQFIVVVNF